jgi:hypothetical protein
LRQRLRTVCRREKITRNTLRKKLGLSPSVFYRLFQSNQNTNTRTALRVCAALGWPIEGLMCPSTRQRSCGLRGRDSWQAIYTDSGCDVKVLGRAGVYTFEWFQRFGHAARLMMDASLPGNGVTVLLPVPALDDARVFIMGRDGAIVMTVYWPVKDSAPHVIYDGVFSDRMLSRLHTVLARSHAFMLSGKTTRLEDGKFAAVARRVKKKLDSMA